MKDKHNRSRMTNAELILTIIGNKRERFNIADLFAYICGDAPEDGELRRIILEDIHHNGKDAWIKDTSEAFGSCVEHWNALADDKY